MRPHHNLDIRIAGPHDATAIAGLWAACEPSSAWAQLGHRLSSIYFGRYCTGRHEIAVTAWSDGVLAGACLGTDRPRESSRRFYVEHAGALAKALAREVVSRPGVVVVLLRRLAFAILSRLKALGPSHSTPSEDPFGKDFTCYVANFFVAPSARGKQLGTLMLDRFSHEMALRGCEWCVVHTTVDNVASQIAQRRAGFECVHQQGKDLFFSRPIAP